MEGTLPLLLPPLPSKQSFLKMANLAHSCEEGSQGSLSGSVTLGYLLNWNIFNLVGSLVIDQCLTYTQFWGRGWGHMRCFNDMLACTHLAAEEVRCSSGVTAQSSNLLLLREAIHF